MLLTSLILADLTPEDERRFVEGRVSYSGATGLAATKESHGPYAPFIATYVSELNKATEAMGWKSYSLESDHGSLVVRCNSRAPEWQWPALTERATRLHSELVQRQQTGMGVPDPDVFELLQIVRRVISFLGK